MHDVQPPPRGHLVIRQAQLDVLDALARERFDRWLDAHVRRYFPDMVTRLGADGMQSVLASAVSRAASFGVESGPDVTRYVELVMQLGPDFPDDPRIPWAGELLRSSALSGDQKLRAITSLLTQAEVDARGFRGVNHG